MPGVNFYDGSSWSEVAAVQQADGSTAPVYRNDGSQWVKIFPSGSPVPASATNDWPTDEGSGTTLTDNEGSINGTINGATWETGAGQGNAYLNYDGSSDWTDLGADSQSAFSHFVNTGVGTAATWIRPDDTDSGAWFGDNVDTGSNNISFRATGDGNARILMAASGGGFAVDASGGTVTQGTWQPLMVVFNGEGNNAVIYLGESVTQVASDTIVATEPGDLSANVAIGAQGVISGSNHINAGLTDTWVSDQAVSTSTLQDWVDATKSYFSDGGGTGSFSSWSKSSANPVLDPGSSGWDSANVYSGSIYYNSGDYNLLYEGQQDFDSSQIGLATSTDRETWSKDSNNPVFGPSSSGFDSAEATRPEIVEQSGTYYMYYSGWDGATYRIGLATSTDLINWSRESSNPLITPGSSGAWDEQWVYTQAVIVESGDWKMLYGGRNSNNTFQIGLATSTDGVSWTKSSSNPVLSPSSSGWDSADVYQPTLIKDTDSTYHLFYRGQDGSTANIGHAYSSDLTNWTKDSDNPVLTSGSGWESADASGPYVLYDGTDYLLYYTGDDNNDHHIGYAVQQ